MQRISNCKYLQQSKCYGMHNVLISALMYITFCYRTFHTITSNDATWQI